MVFALAYLDLGQARSALAARLAASADARKRVGEDMTRPARWRLRRVQGDLGCLGELAGLLEPLGSLADFRGALEAERQTVALRLARLDAADLPPMDLSKCTASLRVNLDLPSGIQGGLEASMARRGLRHRDAGADFILDLAFGNVDQSPEFIFTELTFAAGAVYRVEARMRILDASGVPISKTATVSLSRNGSPEGLVDQLCQAFEKRLTRLLVDMQAELQ